MTTDQKGNLWIGTDRALIMWDVRRKESQTFTQINGLTGNNITTLFCDSRGCLWIGTEERNGLTKHIPGQQHLHLRHLQDGCTSDSHHRDT